MPKHALVDTLEIPAEGGGAPAVPPLARTVLYTVSLVAGGLATAATTLAATLWPAHVEAVAAVGGALTGFLAVVCGGLGVAYRPTAGG
ncbi:MAG: hypothetical protein LBD77_02150 [Bifidobacteriaceae bacterium]|jgi:hypothetical protein|nr:hypothetical protein [Bifidobacteriaceae bacterium]